MGLSFPSKELVATISEYSKEQFAIWVDVIKSPISVISRFELDSMNSVIHAVRFVLFVYAIIFLVALPGMVVFYKIDITKPVFILADFMVVVLALLLFGLLLNFAAKIMRGHGKLRHSLLAGLYLSAFWPIVQTTDYLLLPSPQLRSTMTGESVTTWLPIDYVTIFLALILIPTIGIYLIVKTVPVIKYLHSVGSFRATIIALVAYGFTLIVWQLSLIPLFQGLITMGSTK
jgi:hypothetical protein